MAPPPGLEPGSREICFESSMRFVMTVSNARPDYTTGAFSPLLTHWLKSFQILFSIKVAGVNAQFCYWNSFIKMLFTSHYHMRIWLVTTKPALDGMPFLGFKENLLWSYNSLPMFRQNCFPLMHGHQ